MTAMDSNYQNSPSILIVEDDENVARLAALTLRKINVVTHYRNNGHDALQFLDQFTPELIILDINMSVMTGWQFLELMQEDSRKRQIPVIVLTALSDSTNRMVGRLQGVRAYLQKPIMPDDLRSIVMEVLQTSV